MYLIRRFFQIIVIATEIVKCSAEDGKQKVLGLSGSTFLQRSSEGLSVVRKKEQNTVMNHIRKRALKEATMNIFDETFDVDDDNCCRDDDSSDDTSSTTPSVFQSLNPSASAFPSAFPTINPTLNPTFSEKKIIASDGSDYDYFGCSCSIADDLVVIGAFGAEAAYLFNLDGTEVMKLTAGNDGEDDDYFGGSVSMDEKIVVGSSNGDNYVRVFSRQGSYERTISCNNCSNFGKRVATHGNKIVTSGEQNSIDKLYIYSTEDGQLLKSFEHEDTDYDVAISEQFIVSTALTGGKTFIYSNSSPDFPVIAEINQGGKRVAVSNDRIVIGDPNPNSLDGAAWLYKTDGTLVTALDRQGASSGSYFGDAVAIKDNKVIVGAAEDHDQDYYDSGSVFIYSAVTGEFLEKVLNPDAQNEGYFGGTVCASDLYYMVVAISASDKFTGAAYLFQLP